jgi:hypothetical protein
MTPMTLKSGASMLEFWSINNISYYGPGLPINSVWVSTTGGNPMAKNSGYTMVKQLTADEQEGEEWRKLFVDLTQFAGQQVHIAFKYEAETVGVMTWKIDDIEVMSEDLPIPTYTLTVIEPINGMFEITDADYNEFAPGTHEVEEGTELVLFAMPNTGYEFDAWWDDNDENPRTIVVESDLTISATFKQIPMFKVTIAPSENGMVFAEHGVLVAIQIIVEATLQAGTEITMAAVPNTGYRFVEWMDGVTTPQTDRKLILTQDTTLFAIFTQEVSINDNFNNVLIVYPNPVKDILIIQIEEIIKQIDVFDINGKIVMQVNGNTKTINLQARPSGSYIVRIHTETRTVPVRIVKQ